VPFPKPSPWTLVLTWLTLALGCGGLTSTDDCDSGGGSACGGSLGAAGAPGAGDPITRIAVRRQGHVTLLEFADPSSVQTVPLTDHTFPGGLWQAELGGPSTIVWSPDGEALAWSNDDGTAGAYVDGQIVSAPSSAMASTPKVHWLSRDTLLVNPFDQFLSWEPRSGDVETSTTRTLREIAGGAYVACENGRSTFVSASGETVEWDRQWAFALRPEGDRIALFVPEAGASGLDPRLVDELVLPGAAADVIDCDHPPASSSPEIFALGPVNWSASGRRLGFRLQSEPPVLRVGPSPVDEDADESRITSANDYGSRVWYFRGEDVIWFEPTWPEWPGDYVYAVQRRTEAGVESTLGMAAPGDGLVDSWPRADGHGDVLLAEYWSDDGFPGPTSLYVLSAQEELFRLEPSIDPKPSILYVRTQPDGPGVAATIGTTCSLTISPCEPTRTLVWPDPDDDPGAVLTLSGEAHWLPGRNAVVLVAAPDLWLIELDHPEERVHLGEGTDVLVSPTFR